MNSLRDTLHAMPFLLRVIMVVFLVIAMGADEGDRQAGKPGITRVVDNIGSWLALAVLIFAVIVWYWHE